jgi:hypothetical protein
MKENTHDSNTQDLKKRFQHSMYEKGNTIFPSIHSSIIIWLNKTRLFSVLKLLSIR